MTETSYHLRELERLAREKSPEGHGRLLERMADLYFATSDQQSATDTATFGTIMEQMAFAVEVEVRAHLAERFASADNAPPNLVRSLAHDEICVARPILEQAATLDDGELVDIARKNGPEHLLAISRRGTLSPMVTDALVERGSPPVLASVAANAGACFSHEGLETLCGKAGNDSEILSALCARTDLPPGLLDDIKRTVVDRLTGELAKSHPDLGPQELEALVDHNLAKLHLDAAAPADRQSDGPGRVGRITERMLADFARARRLPETVRCLTILTQGSEPLVTHCLLKANPLALGALCKAKGFATATFAALLQMRSGSTPLRGATIAAAMRGYEMLKQDTARRILESARAPNAEPAAASNQDGD